MTGLADANMDRSPVVAIIGQGSTNRLHKESHQIMDSISMVHPISKWAQTILSPKNITEVVRKAFKVAETEKPGVTVVEFPEDIAKEEIKDTPIKPTLIRRQQLIIGQSKWHLISFWIQKIQLSLLETEQYEKELLTDLGC